MIKDKATTPERKVLIATGVFLGTTIIVYVSIIYLAITYFETPMAALPLWLIPVTLGSLLFETKGALIIALATSLMSDLLAALSYQAMNQSLSGLDYLITMVIPNSIYFVAAFTIGKTNELRRRYEEVMIKSKTEVEEEVRQKTKELEKTREELEEAKEVLEIKVKARTEELEKLTESLEEQVKKRTSELRKRVNELEKIRKVAVGRELKMIELKKEIKRLNQQIKS